MNQPLHVSLQQSDIQGLIIQASQSGIEKGNSSILIIFFISRGKTLLNIKNKKRQKECIFFFLYLLLLSECKKEAANEGSLSLP